MNRVLSLATTGLLLAGLAMVPMSANADQPTVAGKTATTHTDATTSNHADTAITTKPATTQPVTTTGVTSSGVKSTDPTKKDDKVTVAPGTSAPVSGTPTKLPGKSAS